MLPPSCQSHFAFPPAQQAGGWFCGGEAEFLPVKQQRKCWCRAALCVLLPREREPRLLPQNSRLGSWAFCFKENKADLLSGLKAKENSKCGNTVEKSC